MENKQKFGFTKTKACGLCGAILATVTFATTQVNADETTSDTAPSTEQVVPNTSESAVQPNTDKSEAEKSETPKELAPSSDKVEVVEVPKNNNLTGAIGKAEEIGADVTQTDTQKVENEAKANADYDKQAEAIKKAAEEKQKEIDAYNAEKARVDEENRLISERNKAKKDAYDKALQEYLNGTKAQAIVSAKTQNVDNQTYGDSFMNAQVDNEGNFTLTHDMNDGVNIIGQGVLNGKIYYDVKSNGDGSETITVNRIDLFQYRYSNFTKNSAVNKNINFHVYDVNGTEIYSVYHDGESSFTADIYRQNLVSKVFNVKAGQITDIFQVLNVDDNWIYNTHGQVLVQFQNTNATPPKPEYEIENPLPVEPKQLVVAWHLNAYEKEKPVIPVVYTPVSTTPVQKAAVLPFTGENGNILASILGAFMLLISFVSLKKIKKNI